MSARDLRENEWTSVQLFDWLMGVDCPADVKSIHLIDCHLHQSLVMFSIDEINAGLERLESHVGFPRTKCPVVRQDKFAYLCSSPRFFNPTMKIPLPFSHRDEYLKLMIQEFLATVEPIDSAGWVLKKPYVTNTRVKFVNSLTEVYDGLRRFSEEEEENFRHIPYAMIQPCMRSRKEYMVICLGREPQYIANINVFQGGKSFTTSPHTRLFDFVRDAVRSLEATRPGCLTKGLFRVDVFQTAAGELKVNEFESLEASYNSTSENESKVLHFLIDYWKDMLMELIAIAKL